MAHAFSMCIGLVVFCGAIRMVWKSHSRRWNRVAVQYPEGSGSEYIAQRKLQSLIFTGDGVAFNSYKGTVSVGLSEAGLALNLLPPFSWLHPPILIPFGDVLVQPATWYLNTESYKLSFRRSQEVQIIIDSELYHWIMDCAPAAIATSWRATNPGVAVDESLVTGSGSYVAG